MLVRASISRYATVYSSHSSRSFKSPALNFQYFSGSVEAGRQALPLLPPRDVQHELENHRAVLDQNLLEVIDLLVARSPDRLGSEPPDAHDEHVLVVGPVEDPDRPTWRGRVVHPPEEVVPQLQVARGP